MESSTVFIDGQVPLLLRTVARRKGKLTCYPDCGDIMMNEPCTGIIVATKAVFVACLVEGKEDP